MKVLKFKKTIVTATLCLMGSQSWAGDFFAKCTTYSSSFAEAHAFYIPSPGFWGQTVLIESSYSGVKAVDAQIHNNSWTTILASFEQDNQPVIIVFSDYLSPSIAVGTVNDKPTTFACELLNRKSEVPELPKDNRQTHTYTSSNVRHCAGDPPRDYHLMDAKMDCQGPVKRISFEALRMSQQWGDGTCPLYATSEITSEYQCLKSKE